MKRISIVCPVHSADRVNRVLFDLCAIEIVNALEAHTRRRCAYTTKLHRESESATHHFVLSPFDEIAPEHKSFFEGLTPLPVLVEPKELDAALHGFDLDAVSTEARELDDIRKRAERRLVEVRGQMEALAPVADVPFHVADLRRPKYSLVLLGTIPLKQVDSLKARADAPKSFAWEVVPVAAEFRAGGGGSKQAAVKADRARILAACLAEDELAMRKTLASEQFEEIALPEIRGSVRDRIRELEGDHAACIEEIEDVRRRIAAMTKHRRALQVLAGHWDGARRAQKAKGDAIEGQWVHLSAAIAATRSGAWKERFARTRRKRSLPRTRRRAKPCQSITSPRIVRPIHMLINLFDFRRTRR